MKHFYLTIIFLLNLGVDSFCQFTPKGLSLSVGRLYTQSFSELNGGLTQLGLENYTSPFFRLGIGYEWTSKKNISFALDQNFIFQNKTRKSLLQNISSTAIIFSTGYAFMPKEKITIKPSIGFGLNTLTLSIVDNSNSSKNFNQSLTSSVVNNSISNIQGVLQFKIACNYLIKIGDKIETIEGGHVRSVRKLPIGIEIGFIGGNSLSGWTQIDKINDAPKTNLSGLFFGIVAGGIHKKKFFENM